MLGAVTILALAAGAQAHTPNPRLDGGDNSWQLVDSGSVTAHANITSYSGGWYDPDTRRATSTTQHMGLGVVGDADANDRYSVRADGLISWGGGSGVPDTIMARTSAGVLSMASGDSFQSPLFGGTGGDDTLSVGITDDTVIFDSNDSAGVYTCTDADANANCSFAGGGTGTATLGGATNTSASIVTDGASFGIDVTGNAATLTATTTATAVFTGADAAGAADTTYDTTGAGAIVVGSADVTGITLSAAGDVTLPVSETATFGAPDQLFTTPANRNQLIGIPKLNVTQSGAALPNGPILADPYSPLIANCAPTNGSEAAGTLRITGAASYQYTGAGTAAENDGFDCDVTGHAVNGTDSIGFWFRSDTALTAATLDVSLLDAAGVEANADMPAITVVDEWQWIEVDFGTDCDATCADIDGVLIAVTAAGAATSEMDGTVIHVDSGVFWLDAAELAIGDVRVGGVISVSAGITGGGDTAKLVEYTDYFVNYQTGADALVFITDQSANYGTTLEALN